ncbi:hypothetical protein ATORI0001_0759 [Lancefieldella rimae ATCC 49626]|uniref:Uncharacterized protein n=1 Tax=Lancefieldella rimae (strain ATCC 49626 / DSM 7090 / CCUG 31168 / NBRC 15546 / VPI D140H-11A) TaxID=553184 RepID=B9CL44_LANR4|nr:hypothetical protein ATORI0001_0759 [Lancefieldella rimae ATCC 49626]
MIRFLHHTFLVDSLRNSLARFSQTWRLKANGRIKAIAHR